MASREAGVRSRARLAAPELAFGDFPLVFGVRDERQAAAPSVIRVGVTGPDGDEPASRNSCTIRVALVAIRRLALVVVRFLDCLPLERAGRDCHASTARRLGAFT